jgi:hypothetical protein
MACGYGYSNTQLPGMVLYHHHEQPWLKEQPNNLTRPYLCTGGQDLLHEISPSSCG